MRQHTACKPITTKDTVHEGKTWDRKPSGYFVSFVVHAYDSRSALESEEFHDKLFCSGHLKTLMVILDVVEAD